MSGTAQAERFGEVASDPGPEIVVGLGVVDVGQPDGLGRPGRDGERQARIARDRRHQSDGGGVIALGGDDGQAALAQERDDRAACRERRQALLDDEADDAVARRFRRRARG